MSHVVRLMQGSVLVEYGEFSIIDPDGSLDDKATTFAESWELGGPAADWLVAADNLLMVRSAYNAHTASVVLELFDATPPARTLPNAEQAETSFYSSSGSLMVEEMTDDAPFKLGPPQKRWRVRAHRVSLNPAGYFSAGVGEELEAFTFGFWPLEG
ncbi:hypothetical protein AB0K48_32265 [Nonomuraea sp. NPDC055795]